MFETHIMQPNDSIPSSPQLHSQTLFDDAELVNANTYKPTPAKAPEPYIYYRIYTEDGAIHTKSPVYTDDPYLARIWAKQVAPPRTFASLKRCLSAVECLGSASHELTLYSSAKNESPMEDTSVWLMRDIGTPSDPMILFVKDFCGDAKRLDMSEPEAVLLPPPDGETPFKAEFLYYRIYTEDGAIPSKHLIDSSDLSLGRINIEVITPPYTIDSIKRCIAKAEQLRKAEGSKLFKNMHSETPMNTAKVSVLGGGDRLGLSEEDPMVYVHPSTVKYRVTQTAAWRSNGNNNQCFNAGGSDWLDIKLGEILYVETENCEVTDRRYSGNYYSAYKLLNDEGVLGYVNTSYVVKI